MTSGLIMWQIAAAFLSIPVIGYSYRLLIEEYRLYNKKRLDKEMNSKDWIYLQEEVRS